eukprot:GHUV01006657.1.p1 GENE.GHUV01006657.1~~GHUV01006657.1.p1  ORF type:complete len:259 (+),score=72.04 GHUV01006657.1:372-1148(+)
MAANQPASVPLEPLGLPKQILANGVRLDGRGFEEFRSVFVDTKVISRAAGSAYVEIGDTKVMAAVYGPRQSERKFGFSDRGRINCEINVTSMAQKVRGKQAQRINRKELSSSLSCALEGIVDVNKFPKAVVDVYVMVLQADGGELSAAITAAGTALADAGIELLDILPACTVALIDGQLMLDPVPHESAQEQGELMVAYSSMLNQVMQMHLTGSWSASQVKEGLELAMGGCQQLRGLVRQTLIDKVTAVDADEDGMQQ